MKVNELMIGDLVEWQGNPHIIKSAVDLTFAKEFTPIPLTPEILEKNDLPNYEWLKVGFQSEYGNITDFSIKIKYVHKLQQALRFCGLDNLADNFRI